MSAASSRKSQSLSQDRLVEEVSRAVSKATGVILGEKQSIMVASRIKRRITDCDCADEQEYLDYFLEHQGEELPHLISLLTTHHTYFFREFAHFEYLLETALPKLIDEKKNSADKTIRVWSAACSRGQEVYSLAMLLDFYIKQKAPGFKYEILGTDVDPESVTVGGNGVYRDKEIHEIPMHFLANHWARGTGDIASYVKAKLSIKANCKFAPFNLINFKTNELPSKFDIIFCRNVFIYFTPAQTESITQNLLKQLNSTGYLFLGISETLNGLKLAVTPVGPSIYQHLKQHPSPALTAAPQTPARSSAQSISTTPSALLRVLCVDDSPSVITLLKKILSKENGFEVVDTAANGFEANEKLKTLKVDLVTLDIHMPEQDGLSYLKTSYNKTHPPVVMISSVARDDASLALKCLEAGATDYIEKPSLSNLIERSDEIKTKLKFAAQVKRSASTLQIAKELSHKKKTITSPEKKFRILVAGFGDRDKVVSLLKEVSQSVPTLIVVEGAGGAIEAYKLFLSTSLGRQVNVCEPKALTTNTEIKNAIRICTVVYGTASPALTKQLLSMQSQKIMVEDLGPQTVVPKDPKVDIMPATSFAYMCDEYLAEDKK